MRRWMTAALLAAMICALAACGARTQETAAAARVSESFETPEPVHETPDPTPEVRATPEPELILPEDREGLYVSETGDFALYLPEQVAAVNAGTTLDDLLAQGFEEDAVAWLFEEGGPADGRSEFLLDTETYGICFMRSATGYGVTREQMPALVDTLSAMYSDEGEGLTFDELVYYGDNPFWVMHWSGEDTQSVLLETVCDGAGADLCFTFIGMGEDMAAALLTTLIVR